MRDRGFGLIIIILSVAILGVSIISLGPILNYLKSATSNTSGSVNNGKVDPCSHLTGEELRGGDVFISKKVLCYRNLAATTGDISWCRKSTAIAEGDEIDVRCVINSAFTSGNLVICDSLSDRERSPDKSQCINEFARQKQMPELCSKINDPLERSLCNEHVGK